MEPAPAVALRRPFDPAAHELDPNFRLTKFADLKGWGCKVPQEALLKLLEGLQPDSNAQAQEQAHFQYVAQIPRMGKHLKYLRIRFVLQASPLSEMRYCSDVRKGVYAYCDLFLKNIGSKINESGQQHNMTFVKGC